jgi:hypothetical protein
VRVEGDRLLALRVGLRSTGSAAGDNALQGLRVTASFTLA